MKEYREDKELQEEVAAVVAAFLSSDTFAEFCEKLGEQPDIGNFAVWETLGDVYHAGIQKGRGA